jgi:hypothetical protein
VRSKPSRSTESCEGESSPHLVPLCVEASLGRIGFLGFALEVKQGVGVAGRSLACPDPSIAAEEGANQETNRGGIASRRN